MPLPGATVLITGATGGLGKGIALRFAQAGANIVLHHRSSPEIAADFAEKLREFDTPTLTVAGDIRNEDDCRDLVAKAVSKFGRLDALINNDGVHPTALIEDIQVSDWGAGVIH